MASREHRQQSDRDSTRIRRKQGSATAGPATTGPVGQDLLRLQRSVGNQAVVNMLASPEAGGRSAGGLQAGGLQVAGLQAGGLQVGAADDRHEVEADRVAQGAVAAIEEASGPLSARRRVSPSDGPGALVGPEGGPVGADVERSIQSARGKGSPMSEPVRRQMEGSLGADLSGVRLHSGRQADQLNGQLGAEAFTVGKDIFFSGGLPDTSSREGVGLLAHELTHTVQQTGGASRAIAQRTLKFNKTKWSSVKSAKLSGSGGGGAAFLTDGSGPPLVVKAEPGGAAEAVLNAALLEEMLADADYSGWSASTPKARLLDPQEVGQIISKINAAPGEKKGGFLGLGKKKKVGGFDTPTDDYDKRRQDAFKANLQRPGSAIVFSGAKGEDYDKKVDASQPQTDTDVNYSHPLVRMISDPGQMTLFGRIAAADIAIGNDDRIAGKWNSENMLVKWSKGGAKVSLIDNVSDKALLGGAGFSPKDALTRWAAQQEVKMAAAGDFNGLASYLLSDIIDPAIMGQTLGAKLTKDNRRWIRDQIRDNFADLAARLETGLRDGFAAAAKALSNPNKFLGGLPENMRQEGLVSLKARQMILSGQEADASAAYTKAGKSVGVRFALS